MGLFPKFLKFFLDRIDRSLDSSLRASTQLSDFLIAEIIQSMEQKPLPLFLGAEGQYSHNLVQRFPLADHILRGGQVRQVSLGSNYVLVKFALIPMPPLFMIEIFCLAFASVQALSNLGANFDGNIPSIYLDGDLQRSDLRSVFWEN